MSSIALIPVVLGVVGLLAAFIVYRSVLSYSPGSGKVVDIGEKIHRGAMVFMRREYSYLAIFVIVVGALIFVSDLGWKTAVAFFVGALASASAGYIGMYTATRANVRQQPLQPKTVRRSADRCVFWRVNYGLTVAAMGLLGLGALYLALEVIPIRLM